MLRHSRSLTASGFGAHSREDEAEDWIGCDECESWWHYWCAGLDKMLSEEEEWLCDFCQRHDC